ncbi:hypothetical protein [Bacillus swezeyi]|uniref:Uncharacterized protein n=1 Tax=Bacillus swezeyi TaxID=1925020 RepID=A0A5M8RJD6_9BACI|nr:hypothetical protein [Bacillus swezeyi]KAA6446976.1 hypothetical protein DX927_23310 [Bacillus swezeyi]KAA6471544.1 hypothetical protein DX928_23550 [Bacillus swezeyi]
MFYFSTMSKIISIYNAVIVGENKTCIADHTIDFEENKISFEEIALLIGENKTIFKNVSALNVILFETDNKTTFMKSASLIGGNKISLRR